MKTRTYLALALVAGLLGTSIVLRAENLGTVTAGAISGTTISGNTITGGTISGTTITGSTATFGSNVLLDASGITIDSGTGSTNRIKWSDGSSLLSSNNALQLSSDSVINLIPGSNGITISSTVLRPLGSSDLGSSGNRWVIGYLDRANLSNNTPIVFTNAAFTGLTRYLCVNSSGQMFASTQPCV